VSARVVADGPASSAMAWHGAEPAAAVTGPASAPATAAAALPPAASTGRRERPDAGAASRREGSGAAGPPVPVFVLGGSGYVAGELLRLIAGHPHLRLAGVISESQPGQAVAAAFPHLAGTLPAIDFSAAGDLPRLLARNQECASAPLAAALCAAPHGASARLVDGLLGAAEREGLDLRVVDLSADFRFAGAAEYEAVYGHPHGAPARLSQFRCGLPEHAALQGIEVHGARRGSGGDVGHIGDIGDIGEMGDMGNSGHGGHIGHPGCFPTAVLLAAVPLLRLGLVEPCLHVVAVTGSTGAGRAPSAATHHPARRSNLFAYSPLHHRHEPEMRALAAAAGGAGAAGVEIHFVPQAGPFARGIYATLQARLCRPLAAEEVAAALAGFYAGAPFVDVLTEPPRLQDVVGTNRCRLAVATRGDRLVAFSAIDNLVKGAAGGAVQWLNAMLGLPPAAGLNLPGLGWL
jgi:N-acetyl-gamma-glutamylphosphate reductase